MVLTSLYHWLAVCMVIILGMFRSGNNSIVSDDYGPHLLDFTTLLASVIIISSRTELENVTRFPRTVIYI